jgi:peptidoglycan-associated lipoprotein
MKMNRNAALALLGFLFLTVAIVGCKKREPAAQPQQGAAAQETAVEVSSAAQEAPVPEQAQVPDYKFRSAYFAFDKAALTASARSALKKNVKFLSENPTVNVIITGYCDDRGTKKYNLALGRKRANAVKRYYVKQGISKERIKIASFGEPKSKKSKTISAKARRLNRRAETKITL